MSALDVFRKKSYLKRHLFFEIELFENIFCDFTNSGQIYDFLKILSKNVRIFNLRKIQI